MDVDNKLLLYFWEWSVLDFLFSEHQHETPTLVQTVLHSASLWMLDPVTYVSQPVVGDSWPSQQQNG